MGLFNSKPRSDDYTVIVGCGRLGANIANTLSASGRSVLVIDSRDRAFRRLSPSFGGITVTGDAAEIRVLQDANIAKASCVIIVTNNDNTNILIAQLAKELFGVENVIARLYDPERECVYHEFGIETICPAVLSANEIDRILKQKGLEEVK